MARYPIVLGVFLSVLFKKGMTRNKIGKIVAVRKPLTSEGKI